MMKTPITYYGGKQKLAKTIVSKIPNHTLYCEPFVGGAAVFFAKEPSPVEVINDLNSELINFYKVVKNKFIELNEMVRVSLHSRRLHSDAKIIYENPHLFNEIERAWAIWILSTQSFCAKFDGSFGYDKSKSTTTKKIVNKRDSFTVEFSERLQNVQIECADARYIIQSRDSKDSFFYCDPPYFGTACAHYDGYTKDDFELLLKTLSNMEGKFLLSSYPSDLLKTYVNKHGWHQWSKKSGVSVNSKSGYQKRKVEVLTANYVI